MEPKVIETPVTQEVSEHQEWPPEMGRGLRQWAIVCLALGALGGLLGCESDAKKPDGEPREGWRHLSYGLPIDIPTRTMQMSDNLWVIPAGSCYADSLDVFMKEHPGLRVVDSDIGGQTSHGQAYYHVVITEPKN